MNWRAIALVVCAAVLVGAAAPASAQSCDARLSDLQQRSERGLIANRDDVLLTTVTGIEAPVGARGRRVDRSFIIVERGQAETHVEGQPASEASALAREIARVRERRHLLDPAKESRDPIGLLVDRRLRAREVISIAQRLPQADDVWLVTQEPAASPDTSLPAAVARQLQALRQAPDWPSRSAMANEIVAKALAHCTGHEAFFARVDPDRREADRRFRDAIVGAAKNCSCAGVDVDALEAVLLAATEVPPPHHAVPLKFRKRAEKMLILAPDATVQDLAGRLPEGEFVVRWQRSMSSGGRQ